MENTVVTYLTLTGRPEFPECVVYMCILYKIENLVTYFINQINHNGICVFYSYELFRHLNKILFLLAEKKINIRREYHSVEGNTKYKFTLSIPQ